MIIKTTLTCDYIYSEVDLSSLTSEDAVEGLNNPDLHNFYPRTIAYGPALAVADPGI